MEVGGDGPLETDEGSERVGPPAAGRLRWIDLAGPTADDLSLLRERFGFHPLAIEDCASFDVRSKFDDYESALFVVVHSFSAPGKDPCALVTHELHAFVTDDALVTVHEGEVDGLGVAWR